MSTTDALMDDARCIEQCIPGTDMKLAVLISLFARIAGVSADTNSLMDGARCIQQCVPGEDMKLAILISLLSQIAGGGGSGGLGGGITCGTGVPTSTPATGCGIYVQTDSIPDPTIFYYYNGAWH
jgi:hypothetical protein